MGFKYLQLFTCSAEAENEGFCPSIVTAARSLDFKALLKKAKQRLNQLSFGYNGKHVFPDPVVASSHQELYKHNCKELLDRFGPNNYKLIGEPKPLQQLCLELEFSRTGTVREKRFKRDASRSALLMKLRYTMAKKKQGLERNSKKIIKDLRIQSAVVIGNSTSVVSDAGITVVKQVDKANGFFCVPMDKSDVLIYQVDVNEEFGEAEYARLLAMAAELGHDLVGIVSKEFDYIRPDSCLEMRLAGTRLRIHGVDSYAEDWVVSVKRKHFNTGAIVKTSAGDFLEMDNTAIELDLDSLRLSFLTRVKNNLTKIGSFIFSRFKFSRPSELLTSTYLQGLEPSNWHVFKIKCGGMVAHCTLIKNTLVVPHHLSKGRKIILPSGEILCPMSKDKDKDLDCYLRPFSDDLFEEVKLKDDVIVCDGMTSMNGYVILEAPKQFRFESSPKQGWSGLPILKKDPADPNGRPLVCGLYSVHLYDSREEYHVTLDQEVDWIDEVCRQAKEQDVLVSVPCGMGKSTRLVHKLGSQYDRVILIEPRVAIVQSLQKVLNWAVCSGDDEVKTHEPRLIMSHGKFVLTCLSNRSFINSYDLIIVDEAHENSEWMISIMQFLYDSDQKCRVIAMTATPHEDKYLDYSLSVSRCPRSFNPLVEHELTVDKIVQLLGEIKDQNTLVQVPSINFSDKLKVQLEKANKDLKVVEINRKRIEEIGLGALTMNAGEGNVVYIATSVVAFGVTLSVDNIILTNRETKFVDANGVRYAEPRHLDKTEFVQWAGRVGRMRKGAVYYPSAFSEIHTDEQVLAKASAICQLMSSNSEITIFDHTFSVSRVRTAIQVDLPFGMALAFTDPNGNVIVKNKDNLPEVMREKEFPVTDSISPALISVVSNNKSYKIPAFGYHPNVHTNWIGEFVAKECVPGNAAADVDIYKFQDKDIHKLVKTSVYNVFLGVFLAGLVLGLLWYLSGRDFPEITGIVEMSGDFQSTSTGPVDGPTDVRPGIIISKFNGTASFCGSEILFNNTGIVYTSGFIRETVLVLLFCIAYLLALFNWKLVNRFLNFIGWTDDDNLTQPSRLASELAQRAVITVYTSAIQSSVSEVRQVIRDFLLNTLRPSLEAFTGAIYHELVVRYEKFSIDELLSSLENIVFKIKILLVKLSRAISRGLTRKVDNVTAGNNFPGVSKPELRISAKAPMAANSPGTSLMGYLAILTGVAAFLHELVSQGLVRLGYNKFINDSFEASAPKEGGSIKDVVISMSEYFSVSLLVGLAIVTMPAVVVNLLVMTDLVSYTRRRSKMLASVFRTTGEVLLNCVAALGFDEDTQVSFVSSRRMILASGIVASLIKYYIVMSRASPEMCILLSGACAREIASLLVRLIHERHDLMQLRVGEMGFIAKKWGNHYMNLLDITFERMPQLVDYCTSVSEESVTFVVKLQRRILHYVFASVLLSLGIIENSFLEFDIKVPLIKFLENYREKIEAWTGSDMLFWQEEEEVTSRMNMLTHTSGFGKFFLLVLVLMAVFWAIVLTADVLANLVAAVKETERTVSRELIRANGFFASVLAEVNDVSDGLLRCIDLSVIPMVNSVRRLISSCTRSVSYFTSPLAQSASFMHSAIISGASVLQNHFRWMALAIVAWVMAAILRSNEISSVFAMLAESLIVTTLQSMPYNATDATSAEPQRQFGRIRFWRTSGLSLTTLALATLVISSIVMCLASAFNRTAQKVDINISKDIWYLGFASLCAICGTMSWWPSFALIVIALLLPFVFFGSVFSIVIFLLAGYLGAIVGFAVSSLLDIRVEDWLVDWFLTSKAMKDAATVNFYAQHGTEKKKLWWLPTSSNDAEADLASVDFDNISNKIGAFELNALASQLEAGIAGGKLNPDIPLLGGATVGQECTRLNLALIKNGAISVSVEAKERSREMSHEQLLIKHGNLPQQSLITQGGATTQSLSQILEAVPEDDEEGQLAEGDVLLGHDEESSSDKSDSVEDLFDETQDLVYTSSSAILKIKSIVATLIRRITYLSLDGNAKSLTGPKILNHVLYYVNTTLLNEVHRQGVKMGKKTTKTVNLVWVQILVTVGQAISSVSSVLDAGFELARFDMSGGSRMVDWMASRRTLRIDGEVGNKIKIKYPTSVHFLAILFYEPSTLVIAAIISLILGVACDWNLVSTLSTARILGPFSAPIMAVLYLGSKLRNSAFNKSYMPFALAGSLVVFTASQVSFISAFKGFEHTVLSLDNSLAKLDKRFLRTEGRKHVEILASSFSSWQPMPGNFLNTRTALFGFISNIELLETRKKKNIAIIGMGKGGILQGLLYNESNCAKEANIRSFSLDRTNYNISDSVRVLARNRGAQLMSHGEYIDQDLTNEDLVIVDTFKNPYSVEDQYISKAELISNWRWLLSTIVLRMSRGSDLILVSRLSLGTTLLRQICFLERIFSEVSVVLDPVVRGTFSVAIVCRRLKVRDTLEIVGNLLDHELVFNDFHSIRSISSFLTSLEVRLRSGDLVSGQGDLMNEISRMIYSHRVPKTLSCCINESKENFRDIFYEVPEKVKLYDQVMSWPSLSKWTQGKPTIESKIVADHGAFISEVELEVKPVQDREHLTGINTTVATVLSKASLLPLKEWYEVPSQTNLMVVAGLKKRYDFPSVKDVTSRCAEATKFLTEYCVSRAKNFDFSMLTWDELDEVANKKSTAGFMSISGCHSVREILESRRDVLDYVLTNYFDPSKVNHCFHLSPKVERLLTEPGKTKVPRLFSYKTGEVRLVEMACFKKLNDFMADRQCFPFATGGNIFEKSTKICEAFEKYRNPSSIQIEGSKWDGHKEVSWFATSRLFFSEILKAGKGGALAAEMCLRTVWSDGVGTAVSCSGHIVHMMRGNQKSGSWDTSANNKSTNSKIILGCVCYALNIPPEEAIERVTIFIEGDDGLVVGEVRDIVRISVVKDDFYAKCGFPQETVVGLVSRPEDCHFCSMGATRLQPSGQCVPIRSLTEILGKALVSLANKSVNPTYENYARSLSVICSMAAMFWHEPVVRSLYRQVKKLTPSDVVARSVHPSEKWSFVYQLDDLDPKTFDMDQWVKDNLGIGDIYAQRRNEFATKRMESDMYTRLIAVETSSIVPTSNLYLSDAQPEFVLWCSDGLSAKSISTISSYYAESGLIIRQTHSTVLKNLVEEFPSFGWGFSSGTVLQTLRKYRARLLVFLFSEDDLRTNLRVLTSVPALRRLKAVGSKYVIRNERKELYSLTLADNQRTPVRIVYTEAPLWATLLILMLIVILGWTLYQWCRDLLETYFFPLIVRKTSAHERAVKKGYFIESKQDGVLVTMGDVYDTLNENFEMLDAEYSSHPIALVLACSNIADRFQCFNNSQKKVKRTIFNAVKWDRRVVLVKGIPNKSPEIFTVYFKDYENRILQYEESSNLIVPIKKAAADSFAVRRATVGKRIKPSKMLPVEQWTFNGSMVSTQQWFVSSSYGQIDRVASMIQRINCTNNGCALMRISDLYIFEMDGKYGNRYVFPTGVTTKDKSGALILGESQGPKSRDVARPFGADWNWKTKKPKLGAPISQLVFVGGPTGPGYSAKENVRIHLYQTKPEHWPFQDVELVYHFNRGHSRIRVQRDRTAGVSHLPPEAFGDYVEIDEMMSSKYVLVIEGNEAPDRLLTLLGGKCVVLLVEPTHVLSSQSWLKDYVAEEDMICMQVRPSWNDIVDAIRWFEEDEVRRLTMVERANLVASALRRQDIMEGYLNNLVRLSYICGMRTAFSGQIVRKQASNKPAYDMEVNDLLLGSRSESPLPNEGVKMFIVYQLMKESRRYYKLSLCNQQVHHAIRKFFERECSPCNAVIYSGTECSLRVGVWLEEHVGFFGRVTIKERFKLTLECTEYPCEGLRFYLSGGLENLDSFPTSEKLFSDTGTVFSNCQYSGIRDQKRFSLYIPHGYFLYHIVDAETSVVLPYNVRELDSRVGASKVKVPVVEDCKLQNSKEVIENSLDKDIQSYCNLDVLGVNDITPTSVFFRLS
jgi:hypothetical protein